MNLSKALGWIACILKKEQIPYLITGGFAVHVYGGIREVKDIDIEVPEKDLPKLSNILKEKIFFGPGRVTNPAWDVLSIKLL